MSQRLYDLYEIDSWNTRQIYGKLHPERVIRKEEGLNRYLGFRWSLGWLQSFKKRHSISF
jgi:hypothetical protein